MSNKRLLFTKIWLVHFLVYYYTFGLFYQTITEYNLKGGAFDGNNWELKNFLWKVLLSPIVGFVGIYDGFLFFWIFPIIIMGFLVVPKDLISALNLNKKWFLAYLISLILYPLLHIIQLILYGPHFVYILGSLRSTELSCDINIGLSLGLSILINWLIFRKSYKSI